jgi:LytS/YehU family sensor histidine kinase
VKLQNIRLFLFYLFIAISANIIFNFILQNFIYSSLSPKLIDLFVKQAYSLELSVVFIGIAIGIKVFKINLSNLQRLRKLEQDKMSSELDFLKTQINPHFLFNTLNNIYIQTRIEPKIASDMVLKLSDLLRYQLYECNSGKVMLKSEVEYLRNYIDLQKIRIANIDIKFEQKGSFKGLMIYPFMLIPFLDNSFKHGSSLKGVDNFIHVFVDIVEKYLIFTVENSKNDTIVQNNKSSGTGLVNIKRRLELLYQNNYELKIENRENIYYVELKINLE